jgi:hypothetical protein
MRFRIKICPAFDQGARHGAVVGISCLMQGCPSAVIRVVHVRSGGEQSFDKRRVQIGVALSRDTHCEIQERVPIGAALARKLWVIPQQRGQRRDVTRFQSAKGCKKRFRGLGVRCRDEPVHALHQLIPGVEPVLPRIDQLGICFGKRGLTNFFVRTAAEARVPFANLF